MTLAEQLDAKTKELETALAVGVPENRTLTPEEVAAARAIDDEISALKTAIAHEKAITGLKVHLDEAKAFMASPAGALSSRDPITVPRDEPQSKLPAFLDRKWAGNSGPPKFFKGPDALDQAYHAGQFYLASLWRKKSAEKFCETHGMDLAWEKGDPDENNLAMSTGTPTGGGFVVPWFLDSAIINLVEEYGVFRRNARNVQMPSDVYNQPVRTGGLTTYFVGDNVAITQSDKTWGMITLTARKVATLTQFSSELAEDAIISIADDLTREIGLAFATKEDQCGFIGTGISTTYGNMWGAAVKIIDGNHAASVITATTTHTAFSTLTLTDFESCVGALPMFAGIRPAWYISQAGWAASMMRLAEAAGGNTVSNIVNGVPERSFLGYPVIISQVLNTTLTADASKVKCLFGDLSMAAAFGVRRGVTIAASSERYFEYDALAIRGTERFDAVTHQCGNATSAGPLLVLYTPTS
jgi:HK97 family phage major capsid protein